LVAKDAAQESFLLLLIHLSTSDVLLDQHEEQNGGFLVQLVELVLDECLDSVVSNESPAPVE